MPGVSEEKVEVDINVEESTDGRWRVAIYEGGVLVATCPCTNLQEGWLMMEKLTNAYVEQFGGKRVEKTCRH